MDQVITFDKSLQHRLQEYEEVFTGLETVPFAKLESVWAYHLELTIDPCGWQAIWKIPRLKCEELHIPFPTVVLVYISKIDFPQLTALVRILAVQDDDISLPEKHHVPLIQLWPTKKQDKSIGLNMTATANVLEMLRFFYIHLLFPWDEDDDSSDWKAVHLVTRLRLHYDLKNGKIPKPTANHIFGLLNEARKLNNKRNFIMSSCDELDSNVDEERMFADKKMETLIEINVRLLQIQHEIELMENEIFRRVILKNQEATKVCNEGTDEPTQWLVFKAGKPDEYIAYLQKVEALYPKKEATFAADFMTKIEIANSNDTLLLNESQHIVRSQGAIRNFTVEGIGDREKVELLSETEDVMFDCIGEAAKFENLTINSKSTQCAILVRNGRVVFKNCNIFGNKSSSTLQGILVLAGAEVILENCELDGFYIGIVGNSHSRITMENTNLSGAQVGVKVYDRCTLKFKEVTIRDCLQYGFVFETEQDYVMEKSCGSLDPLNKLPDFDCENSKATNNGKCDFIVKKSTISGMDDLFRNPDVDVSVIESDDDMETSYENDHNSTVIEAPVSSLE